MDTTSPVAQTSAIKSTINPPDCILEARGYDASILIFFQQPVIAMSCLSSLKKQHAEPELYLSSSALYSYCPILPGLPDDVAKSCLALVPWSYFPAMGAVCKRWRSFIQSREFTSVRKEAGKVEELLYVLTSDVSGKRSHWEVLNHFGNKNQLIPPMPGPVKSSSGLVVLDGKLLVIAGMDNGTQRVSSDVYQYDCRLNRWNMLANLNVARYGFACAEVKGVVYVIGGYGSGNQTLSSVEVYNPEKNEWTFVESLRHPRWGCFACSFQGKLYVMGGRSSSTIGNSKFIDMYNPKLHSWYQMKNGCVMVTAHAMLGKKLYCLEWWNQRKMAVFDLENNSWQNIPMPLIGSSAVGFQFGVLDGKLLLFSMKKEPRYRTLVYDPEAPAGAEWTTSSLKPSSLCFCSVTIET